MTLDLDAIECRYVCAMPTLKHFGQPTANELAVLKALQDVPALCARVRELENCLRVSDYLLQTANSELSEWDDNLDAMTVERDALCARVRELEAEVSNLHRRVSDTAQAFAEREEKLEAKLKLAELAAETAHEYIYTQFSHRGPENKTKWFAADEAWRADREVTNDR